MRETIKSKKTMPKNIKPPPQQTSQRENVCLASLHVHDAWQRQTPNNDYVWGATHFSFNNEKGCSWLCVFGEPPNDWQTTVPRHRRIVIIAEPKTIGYYPSNYLNQFGIVISPYQKPALYRGQWHRSPPYIEWQYGLKRTQQVQQGTPQYRQWHEIKATKKKTKLISVICSGKTHNRSQVQRLRFVEALKKEFGTHIDSYGRDDNFVADKADALDPYRYHIALENNQDKHFWTEKLADCYLSESYPIYAGCPNAHDYFPRQSYAPIDIFNIPQAIQQVKDIIASNLYEKNRAHILEAKRRVMEEHQLFPAVARIIHAHKQDGALDAYTPLTTPEPIQESHKFISPLRQRYSHYVNQYYWYRRTESWRHSIKKRLPF